MNGESIERLRSRPNRFSLGRRIAAFSIGLPLATMPPGCTVFEYPAPAPTYTPYELPSYYDKECVIIPDDTIEATEDVFADTWEAWQPMDMTVSGEDSFRARVSERLAVADELGLTVYDYRSEYADLSENLYAENPGAIPVTEYFTRAQEFLSRYGVTLGFYKRQPKTPYDLVVEETYSYKDMELEDALETKQQLYGLIESIGDMPVELIQLMGLEHVALGHLVGDAAGLSVADREYPNTAYVDPILVNPNALIHEAFHIWDARECGPNGMWSDTQYDDLNPELPADQGSIYTGQAQPSEGYLSTLGSFYELGDLYTAIQLADTEEDKASIQQRIDAIKNMVVVAQDYGFTNIVEDKATMAETIFSMFVRNDLEEVASPVLREKMLLLLGRVYDKKPEIVEYLARTSNDSLNMTNVLAD